MVNSEGEIIKEIEINEPLILSLQNVKQFFIDRDLQNFLNVMKPINVLWIVFHEKINTNIC